MSLKDLDKRAEEVLTFARMRDWEQFHTAKNIACALSVEASELLEIFQWKKGDEQLQDFEPHEIQNIKDEVADVAVYLIRLCQILGIDLNQSILDKMVKNAKKYPVEKAKGSSKKYDQL